MFSAEILLYLALGFVAQLVDGALGMAYGLIATSFLLASGTSSGTGERQRPYRQDL